MPVVSKVVVARLPLAATLPEPVVTTEAFHAWGVNWSGGAVCWPSLLGVKIVLLIRSRPVMAGPTMVPPFGGPPSATWTFTFAPITWSPPVTGEVTFWPLLLGSSTRLPTVIVGVATG